MQRSSSCRQILRYGTQIRAKKPPHVDVFINHRRIDTNKNIAGLLYDHLSWLKLRPFLDSKTMKPGDKLLETIDMAIRDCKVGIAVFSPRYCESYFCLHELAMIMECRKKVIPVFVDLKPSELRVVDDGSRPDMEMARFRWAVEEAKHTVGLTFDSSNGDWSDLLRSAADVVMKNLLEVEGEKTPLHHNQKKKHSKI